MSFTPSGISILCKLLQKTKARSPMEVTVAGIDTLINEVQLIKTSVPIEFILEPNVIAVTFVLPLNM